MQAGRLYAGIGRDVYTCIIPAQARAGPTMRSDGGLFVQADPRWLTDVTDLFGDVHLGSCILFQDLRGRSRVGCVVARVIAEGQALFKMDEGHTVLLDLKSTSKWCLFRELRSNFAV